MLNWYCSNAVVETDPGGACKLSKRRSRERIDGLVALVMAVGLSAREPGPSPPAGCSPLER
jgi:phage terminase large subunit-like protein